MSFFDFLTAGSVPPVIALEAIGAAGAATTALAGAGAVGATGACAKAIPALAIDAAIKAIFNMCES